MRENFWARYLRPSFLGMNNQRPEISNPTIDERHDSDEESVDDGGSDAGHELGTEASLFLAPFVRR